MKAKIKQYFERRKKDPRKDLEFLNTHKREDRICHTKEQAKFFLSKHLRAADRCNRNREKYLIVMDVEQASDPKFSWHEQELKKSDISEAEIRDRRSEVELIRVHGERTFITFRCPGLLQEFCLKNESAHNSLRSKSLAF